MNKKILLPLLGILVAITITAISIISRQSLDKSFHLTIFSIVEIEPIAQLRKGFIEEFKSSKFAQEHEIRMTEENAQGDSGLVNQIADKIITQKPNLVYVLGTPAAQAVQKRDPNILLVQGAVTDPVAAGLAKSWEGSGRNYVATSDLPPIDKQIRLIQELTPKVSKLGLIYNPGEVNSVAVISRLRKYITDNKLTLSLVERPIANSSEVARAVQTLAGNVDAIYIPPDLIIQPMQPYLLLAD
jgi:putative ABC transport system substrate-binding protein